MAESYEQLVEKAYKILPETIVEEERFVVPKVKGHIQGNSTVLSNFMQIADTIGRKPQHLLKYILKELATPGELRKNGVIIGTKMAAARINEKIEKYVEEFVLCRECHKPDTKLLKEGNFVFMKCMACGARHSVNAKI
ncbi:translation initiation factor IF-2 subunit beta [Candidatus Woesearchaeota archaeon]|nr:translation initiation factor IF-2 subunit beta [Candidatus Woesearchaeota archaeon]